MLINVFDIIMKLFQPKLKRCRHCNSKYILKLNLLIIRNVKNYKTKKIFSSNFMHEEPAYACTNCGAINVLEYYMGDESWDAFEGTPEDYKKYLAKKSSTVHIFNSNGSCYEIPDTVNKSSKSSKSSTKRKKNK